MRIGHPWAVQIHNETHYPKEFAGIGPILRHILRWAKCIKQLSVDPVPGCPANEAAYF